MVSRDGLYIVGQLDEGGEKVWTAIYNINKYWGSRHVVYNIMSITNTAVWESTSQVFSPKWKKKSFS